MSDSDPRSRITLPANRAFVVQFASNPVGSAPFCGRAEHLASGEMLRFDSLESLTKFFASMLVESPAAAPANPSPGRTPR